MRDYVRAVGVQFRLMVNRREFHLAYVVNLGYVLLTYLHYVICYWGQDVSRVPSPSAMCALLTDSRFFGVYVSIVPFLAVFPFAMSLFGTFNLTSDYSKPIDRPISELRYNEFGDSEYLCDTADTLAALLDFKHSVIERFLGER